MQKKKSGVKNCLEICVIKGGGRRLMANTILNFHFDNLHTSLNGNLKNLKTTLVLFPISAPPSHARQTKSGKASNELRATGSKVRRASCTLRGRERGRGQLTVSWTSSRPACRQAGDKQLACLLEASWLRGDPVSLSNRLVF